ncbi:MAG TPA: methionine--tRNA ligase [Polyangiaceae bacterium]|jgi:methionyl-tRNA synthetase
MPRTLYVSTAIPYVNAPPHLGFALEIVLADALARHARARGEQVHFVTGTDDNSLKNVRAAEAAGVSAREIVDRHAARYRELKGLLDLSFDDFVRTSADPRHLAAVHALWEACARAGDLERRPYGGLYCVGCEQFFDPAELQAGLCPEHGTAPELVEEENWFFRLSRYERPLRDALHSGRLRIEPPERAREIERFLDGGLRDISVSRSRARARGWGIPVPGDPDQVIWVWFDALANYLATLGYPDSEGAVERFWERADRRVHVLGKGILRFHAVLWPALLLAAGLPLPTALSVHGYVTVGGEKIGKSRGNAIEPGRFVERFGVDALRYFLLRHIGPRNDADIDERRVDAVYRAELADGLGNLLSRTLALVQRYANGIAPVAPELGIDPLGDRLAAASADLGAQVDEAIGRLAPEEALGAITRVVDAANKHLAETAPWALAKEPGNEARVLAVLAHATSALGAIGRELAPFLPGTSTAILRALAHPGERSPILFPKE